MLRRHLPADQFVELDVIRRRHHLRIVVVDLELRGRNLRMILFVLESHRPLHFRRRIDKRPQRIARQRMIIAACIHIFELARLVVSALGVRTKEQKTFDFVRRIQRVALLLVQSLGERS